MCNIKIFMKKYEKMFRATVIPAKAGIYLCFNLIMTIS